MFDKMFNFGAWMFGVLLGVWAMLDIIFIFGVLGVALMIALS